MWGCDRLLAVTRHPSLPRYYGAELVDQHDTTNLLLAHLSPSDCAAATERGNIVELDRGRDLALPAIQSIIAGFRSRVSSR